MTDADEKAMLTAIDPLAWRMLADEWEERGENATVIRQWRWMATIFEAWLWLSAYAQAGPPMTLDGRVDLSDGFFVKCRRTPHRIFTALWYESFEATVVRDSIVKLSTSLTTQIRGFSIQPHHLQAFSQDPKTLPPSAYRKRSIRKKLRLICDEALAFERRHGV